MSFYVVKQFDGRYRWYGMPTNNAMDRDREVLSGLALEEVIDRQKAQSDMPVLEFFHINMPLGPTDYMTYGDGFVVATGLFDQDPIAEKMAQFVVDHPAGLDGSGWGMSHGFTSNIGYDGVYHKISRIREFTFLPLSRASNPFTSFSTEVQKMLKEEQLRALDMVLNDPTLLDMARTRLAAQQKSFDLDNAGVVRKSANPMAAAFGFDTSTPTFEKAGKFEAEPVKATQYTTPNLVMGDQAGPTSNMNGIDNLAINEETEVGECAECGHHANDHEVVRAAGERGKCNVKSCKCMGYKAKDTEPSAEVPPMDKARKADDADEDKARKAAPAPDDDADEDDKPQKRGKKAVAKADDEDGEADGEKMLDEVAKAIAEGNTRVEKLIEKLVTKIEALETRVNAVEQGEEKIKAHNERPRLSLVDRIEKMSASRSDDTVMDRRTSDFKRLAEGAPDLHKLNDRKPGDETDAVKSAFGF